MLLSGAHCASGVPPEPLVLIVDIIPESLSGETDGNTEPNLAVNPANPSQIAASAYLPSTSTGRNMSSIFISTNGGTKWGCHSIVPMPNMSRDVTLRFGGSSNMLYVAALNDDYDFLICRSSELATRRMDDSLCRQLKSDFDQPYIAVATIDRRDKVFVGINDWAAIPGLATVVRSLDGTADSPNSDFTPVPIEFVSRPRDRPTGKPTDDPEIRVAFSADGKKVYAVFNRVTDFAGPKRQRTGDVVLVRDDNGGNSRDGSFTALRDENRVAGSPVKTRRTFFFNSRLGRDRLGGDLAIAVDPENADNVYVVWGELLENQPALQVVRSKDGGQRWSEPPLRTIRNAKNPGLAINNKGTLAFLYQQVDTSDGPETWLTKVELTKDDFKHMNPLTLSKFPAAELDKIPKLPQPRLGDYLHLMTVGDVFYGIFPASNVPDESRFPPGRIQFQRRKDFATKKLLDADGTVVESSVDPFFFKLTEQ
jgi:hypothetical protein